MANAIRKFWNSLMEVEEDWESELDYPEEQRESYSYEYEEPEQERRQSTRRSNQANVTAFPGAYSGKLIVYRPVSYEDTQNIIDNLKAQKAVIVNMERSTLRSRSAYWTLCPVRATQSTAESTRFHREYS